MAQDEFGAAAQLPQNGQGDDYRQYRDQSHDE
jgi:hypothetical protein